MTRLLVLVPTEFEEQKLRRLIAAAVAKSDGIIATCGLGVISSGIQTTRLLHQHQPDEVILIGIAGALGPGLQVGTATAFSRIGCYGIGAGSGSEFRTAGELGWSQWNSSGTSPVIGDVIELERNPFKGRLVETKAMPSPHSMLLTVCAASAGPDDAASRLSRFPDAVAEDMEGFSVATACQLAGVPLAVVRGISNQAGDRDKGRWKVDAALDAAAECLISGHLT